MPPHTRENGHCITPQIAVVVVPLPAQGHLNQLLHLSRILSSAAISIHYVGAATHLRQAKLRLHGWDNPSSTIHFHELPTPPFPNPTPNPHAPNKFPSHLLPSFSAATHLRQPVHSFLTQLSPKFKRLVVIFDSLMSYVVQDIDSIPNAEAYCFRCISAFTVLSFYWDAAGRPAPPPAIMTKIPPLAGIFPPEFSEFTNLNRSCRKISSADLYNSSREIEGLYLDFMETVKTTGTDKIFAIGPLNPISLQSKIRHEYLDWLDAQDHDSVILVSFGTTTSFQTEQIRDLALGLERSEVKFIWVLREADKGDIFGGGARAPELPEGFEERVRERGVVVREWAAQVEILGHPATGGFMSHCGWNSCMESISNGVPMAAWPMHSDQPTNAFLVAEVLGIAVRVVDWVYRNEVVAAERVEAAVRRLMMAEEGGEMRRRAKELGASLSRDGEMDSFITHITR
ncbi:zeatin O-glucosyltransferase-like [Salvia miltiorrhiza]|uniref:zeatin O-glucosyltransferase-like n=1 Tax=Salvia miltiorrhiza TaxID=226208 RepID=UPI0025ACC687|nr:zeatin O-glucosyltransferase-like [Salvia miltiorrhiza]